jgi:hypothetical protein
MNGLTARPFVWSGAASVPDAPRSKTMKTPMRVEYFIVVVVPGRAQEAGAATVLPPN